MNINVKAELLSKEDKIEVMKDIFDFFENNPGIKRILEINIKED